VTLIYAMVLTGGWVSGMPALSVQMKKLRRRTWSMKIVYILIIRFPFLLIPSYGYQEITPPWYDGWVQKSHGSCVATINTDTGVGRAYAYPIIGYNTWAECGIITGLYRWTGDDTSEAAVCFKDPSNIQGDMINTDGAYASVTLSCVEFTPQGQLSREWVEEVYRVTNTGNFNNRRLQNFIQVVKDFGIFSKEHNGDYLTDSFDVEMRFQSGLDAINIAPENNPATIEIIS